MLLFMHFPFVLSSLKTVYESLSLDFFTTWVRWKTPSISQLLSLSHKSTSLSPELKCIKRINVHDDSE